MVANHYFATQNRPQCGKKVWEIDTDLGGHEENGVYAIT
jgi:hypothetical protein